MNKILVLAFILLFSANVLASQIPFETAALGSGGLALGPGEAGDLSIAVVKSSLKKAALKLDRQVYSKALETVSKEPGLFLDMANFVAKHEDKVESTKTYLLLLSQGSTAVKTTEKMLLDYGDLPLRNTESLGRAVKGLGADEWSEVEKKGLHRIVGGYPDGQGDLVLTSMKNSGVWDDKTLKQAIELGEDSSKLKNFTKEPSIGGRQPDAKFVVNNKEFVIESARITDKVKKEGNLDNFIKIRIDDKYSQISPPEFFNKDNSIVIGLANGIEDKLTMQEISVSLKNVINQNSTVYRNLSRALIKNELTGEIILVNK